MSAEQVADRADDRLAAVREDHQRMAVAVVDRLRLLVSGLPAVVAGRRLHPGQLGGLPAAAALLADLKARGLLDDTLVVWTTEFGRMPTFQKGTAGRDHNPKGFTAWLTGAGVKRGFSFGATDEFGYQAVENVVDVHDFHATILHLLGFDHERLTYNHNGTSRRLTDVHGHVIRGVLA